MNEQFRATSPGMSGNVDRDRKFVMIHVPKTGGTSLRKALQLPKLGAHARWSDFQELLGAEYDRYFKFGFVRNPWSRFLSFYHYVRQEESYYHSTKKPGQAIYGKHRLYDLLSRSSLNEAVHYLLDGRFLPYHGGFYVMAPQYKWLYNDEGNCQVDFVGRYETLAQDFQHVCQQIGMLATALPHVNKSSLSVNDYRTQYDPESKHLLALYYEKDIDIFKYTF